MHPIVVHPLHPLPGHSGKFREPGQAGSPWNLCCYDMHNDTLPVSPIIVNESSCSYDGLPPASATKRGRVLREVLRTKRRPLDLAVAAACAVDASSLTVGNPTEFLEHLLAVGDAAGDPIQRLRRQQQGRLGH